MKTWVTVGEASRASGLPVETIRYYERIGVLPPVPRAPNGYRSYAAAHLETLRFARGLRDLGLSPGATASLVALVHNGTCADMQGALGETIDEALERVETQKKELARTATRLRQLLGAVRSVAAGDRPSGGPLPCDCVAAVERDLGPNESRIGGRTP